MNTNNYCQGKSRNRETRDTLRGLTIVLISVVFGLYVFTAAAIVAALL